MIKKIINNINNINYFSEIVIKTGLTLSIGYFIIAMLCQSTIDLSNDIILSVHNIRNFIYLGTINFFMYLILGYVFEKKIKIK